MNVKLVSENVILYYDTYLIDGDCGYRCLRIILSTLFNRNFTTNNLQYYLKKSWEYGFDSYSIKYNINFIDYALCMQDSASILGYLGYNTRCYEFHNNFELIFTIVKNYFDIYNKPIYITKNSENPHTFVIIGYIIENNVIKLIAFDPNIAIDAIHLDISSFIENKYHILFVIDKIKYNYEIELAKKLANYIIIPFTNEQHPDLPIELKNNYLEF